VSTRGQQDDRLSMNLEGTQNSHLDITNSLYPNKMNAKQVVKVSQEYFKETKTRKKRNKMSFTMKRIDKTKVIDMNPHEPTENISSFSCRADVIYKKILREFRRFFINDFIEKTGFKDYKK